MVKVVGFGGLSSSGKSSVARQVAKLIPGLCLIHQDDFYLPPDQIPYHPVLKEQNWDTPDAIEFDRFIETLDKIRNDPDYKYHVDSLELDESTPNFKLSEEEVAILKKKIDDNLDKLNGLYLVDGFMLYVNQKVIDQLNLKIFYKAPYIDCKTRREARQGYNVIGGFWVDPPGYFEKMVWPEYYQSHKQLFVNGDDEELIKRTGGELNDYAKGLGLKEFDNPNGMTLFDLVNSTLEYIIESI